MNKGNHNRTWLIITAIIIGIVCIPVSGYDWVPVDDTPTEVTILQGNVSVDGSIGNGILGDNGGNGGIGGLGGNGGNGGIGGLGGNGGSAGLFLGNGGNGGAGGYAGSGGYGGRGYCPDLKIDSISYPSTVNRGGEFTITITVTNSGTDLSRITNIGVKLPDNVIITSPATVPLLTPGETKEITFTITIPPGVSIGNNLFTVTLDPGLNTECSLTNNEVSGSILVLPEGMTLEEYNRLTSPPMYKITGPPFVNPPTGGGGPPPA